MEAPTGGATPDRPQPAISPSDRRTSPFAPASSRAAWLGAFLLPAALVLISRIPLLGPEYGLDPDAWRVAWAARTIATTGVYSASRFPSFPVQEIVSGILWPGGPLALTGASCLMAALAAGFCSLIFRGLGSRDGLWAALAMVSAPAAFLTSVQATDYAWGLGLALGGLYFALAGRTWAAGILTGLAIGCRVTWGAWLVPLAFALAGSEPRARRCAAVIAGVGSALAVGGIAYLPPLFVYGTGFLHVYHSGNLPLLFAVKAATVDLWGIPGTLAVAGLVPLGVFLARRSGTRSSIPRARAGGQLLAAWAIGLGIFWALFLVHPMKAAYLIPTVPLVLLLCGRLLERRAFLVLCAALVVSPWFLKVSQPGKADSAVFPSGTRTFRVGGQLYTVDWLRGPAIVAHARAGQAMRYVDPVLDRAHRLEGESVVVAWEWLPQIQVRLGGKAEGRVRYVYLLTRPELADLRARGTPIYDLDGVEAMNAEVTGVSLRENGSRLLVPTDLYR